MERDKCNCVLSRSVLGSAMAAMTSLFGAGGQAKDVQPVLLASLRWSQKMLKSKGEVRAESSKTALHGV